ncbi:cadherin-23 [Copidosoma floridanum]|uniref:cadherin-23 n=1 Tax=Copidosoma floridanum TaxID=29053 RepID=UPI000C6F8D7D|nr:cadherin-23 [Copidosoma floridanum]
MNSSELVLNLPESPKTPVGMHIYHLKGFDPDGDELTFGVRSHPDSDVIRIERSTISSSYIVLNKPLDWETKKTYELILTLTDGKLSERNFVALHLTIIVIDINDNAPIFKPHPTNIQIREDSKPGSILMVVHATDLDEGRHARVNYSLKESEGDNDIFSVDQKGIIRLEARLDYERKSRYQLTVLAKDQPSNELDVKTGTTVILVQVKDVEDQPPVFTSLIPVSRISEDAPIGTSVLQVRAIDGDRGINNSIAYSLTRSPKRLFDIDSTSGTVFTIGRLDREDPYNIDSFLILEITAKEIGSSVVPEPFTSAEVTIHVEDVNDETPTFRDSSYELEIIENAPYNTPLTFVDGNAVAEVFDHDLGENGTFTLTIEGDDGIFEVSPSQGRNDIPFQIKVKNSSKLDFEIRQEVIFTLVARETVADEPKQSSVPVRVHVRDQNDNYPEFEYTIYNVSIPENPPFTAIVIEARATDLDSNFFGTRGIKYTNLIGSIADALSLNSNTGLITIKKPGPAFDRERFTRHYLTIEASDELGRGNRNTAQLIINIVDVNDNRPVFLQNSYEAVLKENEWTFEKQVKVQAIDDDQGENSRVVYSIEDGKYSRNFVIDPENGTVFPIGPMDFEALPRDRSESSQRQILLYVLVTDCGTPNQTSVVQLRVYFNDLNDEKPRFLDQPYKTTVKETEIGGTSILQVKAQDDDLSSPNNKITYRMVEGYGKFVIHPVTGWIKVAPGANLDLGDTPTTEYKLSVIAMDNGIEIQNEVNTTVLVKISDVNNKPPVFINPGVINIKEDTLIGTYILNDVIAHDPDTTSYLHYRIVASSSEARSENGSLIPKDKYNYLAHFKIDKDNGSIQIVKVLDREIFDTMKLGIAVDDLAGETGGQSTYATLDIIVEDVNDNHPKFSHPLYKYYVTENSKNGVRIGNVLAYDADKDREITYAFNDSPDVFPLINLDSKTGEMTVAGHIDREKYSWLNFTVKGSDSGSPPKSSLVPVFVQVIDENDNNPYFMTTTDNFTVPENAKVGTRVAVITALDRDEGDYGKVTYVLDKRLAEDKFAINPNNGSIVVIGTLDRETKDKYTLSIEARDNYPSTYAEDTSRKQTMQITVEVTDVNDNVPTIKVPEKCVTIGEDYDIENDIITMTAHDDDDNRTPNGKTNVLIVRGNENGYFTLVQPDFWTVKLKASDSLRDKVGKYEMQLEVQDLGEPPLKTQVTLKVCVTDINDHAPIFTRPQDNIIKVSENETIGVEIVQVEAIDSDFGKNGDVRYELKQDIAGHYKSFAIDEKSGRIYLKQILDRETQKSYEIQIIARDLGEPVNLSSNLDIIIHVQDEDDFEPEFETNIYNTSFTEGKIDEIVVLPDAIDKDEVDELDLTKICYYIVGGNDEQLFELDKYNNTLTVTRELDREARESYEIVVKATDNCNMIQPVKQDFYEKDPTLLKVVVTVTDVNDEAPHFVRRVFTGGVTTDADFGTEFMHVQAKDSDSGENAIVKYYLIGKILMTLSEGFDNFHLQPFLVDENTGAIKLNFDPQRGMKGYFDFTVLANDTHGLNDTAKVFIYLLREDQRVRFVLRQHPSEIRSRIEHFREVLGNVTNSIVNVDECKVHANQDGTVDRTRTDLYLHFVRRQDNSILEVSEILQLVDRNIEELDGLFKDFNVLDTQPAEPQSLTQSQQASTTIWLSILTVFLTIMLAICIFLCMWQKSSYERQLKAANANPFVLLTWLVVSDPDFPRGPGQVPNTNKHCAEGSNPIWMHVYENEWFKTEGVAR